MNHMKTLAAIVFFYLIALNSFAQTTQEEETLSLDSGTINNQFEYVIKKSSGWKDERGQQYKVTKVNWLYELKAHTLDSLKAVRKDLIDTQNIVTAQANEISELKTNLNNTQKELVQTNTEKNSMSFFGLQMSKTGYNVLMWAIIAALLALLLFFIYKFKNSNSITKDAKQALHEIEEEFEEHRKTALEREQKVRRQLQDEINKQKISKNNKQ
ncbi:MAG: tRNA (guanine-N1)-methyltransferase [Flavobacteriales bacterium]|nr:tRNA (guanine-N1)-methyltransferase [Flavobacteriia bacterium]NCP07027.1 tRNA (guanine-N1)-methyltransferase [Flavobacteriales bacterium]PIV93544.1 MAG: tRNA (guanine-N1)-methyltransferase [Flavobacteriaceae bacterium CG17_big_fil_post_rev_8_21_14_2_50_33_15]PIY09697.1 MAG: tRNA (guanine-N1)-methyltransferase [Flavobacteriaceae bacterium CG_4_10_14_3_um_filter_33_47]PJB16583.1 MAG: tRNA (guanine-N1)-methyltransferase [Flavobacteriaceae bacterium CG_4_9_14_3_um_filter_33_16]